MLLLGAVGKKASEMQESFRCSSIQDMYARRELPFDKKTTLYASDQCTSDLILLASYDFNKCLKTILCSTISTIIALLKGGCGDGGIPLLPMINIIFIVYNYINLIILTNNTSIHHLLFIT